MTGRPALVVFDVFGTLVIERARRPKLDEALRAVRAHLQLTPMQFVRLLTAVRGMSAQVTGAEQAATYDLLEQLSEQVGLPYDRSRYENLLWSLLGDRPHHAAPGAPDLLLTLREQGCVLRLLSNCLLPGPLMTRLLSDAGVPDVFDAVCFSADGGPRKPSAAAFARAGGGQFSHRIMVGDSERDDIAPALALGWSAVLVRPGENWASRVHDQVEQVVSLPP